MSAERDVWKRLDESALESSLGFLPGALSNGVLTVATDESGDNMLRLRAFRDQDDPIPGRPAEFCVSGLEVLPDFSGIQRLPSTLPQPHSATELEHLVRSTLETGSDLIGMLPSADTASLFAVREGTGGELRVRAAWWEDASNLVVLPIRVTVPEPCLVAMPVVTAQRAAEGERSSRVPGARQPAHGPLGVVPAPRRRALVSLGAFAVLVMVGLGVWTVVRPPSDNPPLDGERIPATIPRPPVTDAITPLDTSPVSRGESLVVETPARDKKGTARPARSASARRGDADANTARGAAGPVTQPQSRATLPVRVEDASLDEAELRSLYDLSTDTVERSARQWRDLAGRAERLLARLVEPDNRSEAARVILRAFGQVGGSPGACRHLAELLGATAGERRLFRDQNRCP